MKWCYSISAAKSPNAPPQMFSAWKPAGSHPAPGSGCLEGVTAALLLEIGPAGGVPVRGRASGQKDLLSADEVFIFVDESQPARCWKLRGHIYAQAPGPITRGLTVFDAYIQTTYATQKTGAAGP